MPEAQPLSLLRRDIDRKPEKIRKVLTGPGMRKHILGGIANDEKKAIKAFAGQNQDNALKTKPKVRRDFLRFIVDHLSQCRVVVAVTPSNRPARSRADPPQDLARAAEPKEAPLGCDWEPRRRELPHVQEAMSTRCLQRANA